jgi:hypothetical protein
MSKVLAAGACAMAMGAFGCAVDATDATEAAESELRTRLAANEALRCSVESSDVVVAVVPTRYGKASLVSLEPAGRLYALSSSTGSLSTSNAGLTWTGSRAGLALRTSLKGTWRSSGQTYDVTCAKVAGAEAASWRTANALTDYASEIDGIADAVLEESTEPKPKPYAVFAVEAARRGSLPLGKLAADSAGRLSAQTSEDDSLLDENDFGFGAMSAAYSLGGGDDYGEWFQAVSDGVSLISNVTPALGPNAVAGFIARENVAALSTLVDRRSPSAVEITVGSWTFFLPDAFPK